MLMDHIQRYSKQMSQMPHRHNILWPRYWSALPHSTQCSSLSYQQSEGDNAGQRILHMSWAIISSLCLFFRSAGRPCVHYQANDQPRDLEVNYDRLHIYIVINLCRWNVCIEMLCGRRLNRSDPWRQALGAIRAHNGGDWNRMWAPNSKDRRAKR